MSDLQTSVVPLTEGLDLSSSKLATTPGSLLSCLNYEITDTQGLSRIDGYEPYDAQTSPALTSLYVITCASPHGVADGDIIAVQQAIIGTEVVEENLLVDEGDFAFAVDADYDLAYAEDTVTAATTAIAELTRLIVVGKVVDSTLDNANQFLVAVDNLDFLNSRATYYTIDMVTGTTGATIPAVTSIRSARDTYATASDYNAVLLSTFNTLRADITELGYPAAGLHYFRDTLYAVAPLRQFVVRNADAGGTEIAGNWTHTLVAGSWIGNDVNAATAFVSSLRSETDINSVERLYLDVSESDYDLWTAAIAAGAALTGTGFAVGTATGAIELRVASTQLATDCLTGTLWESKSVQQRLDDGEAPINVGWRIVNQGYTVDFEGGTYATAEIPKLERAILTVPTAAQYWLTDGTNTYSCDLVSYYKDDVGEFTTNDATGTLQIRNITLVDGSLIPIDNTFDLHSAYPIAAPTKVADLSSDLVYNGLPTNPLLVQDNVRYEFISANFYADADWDAMYGVNGVGRAFYYTGDLFAKIFTQASSVKDRPRHVEYHLDHLALGFKEGSVQLSVAGLPHSFAGLDGASDIGVGDRVTGLMSLSGDTLGVFCEQSIRAISGSVADNFTSAVITPKTGCIEYTLVNIGVPVYCNSSGIMTLDQSQKYGDFVGIPLSFQINSFLRPRLNRVSGRFSPQSGVLAAMAVRAKNQYRLFFKDGVCLTMTIPGDGTPPKFTQQELTYLTDDGEYLSIVPFAISSQTDQNGEELLHFSYYDSKTGNALDYVYELDKGWGFQGDPIAHEFETNWFAGESPNTFFGVQKVRLHGITRGSASLKVAASGVQNSYDDEYNSEEQYIDLPRAPVFFTDAGTPASNNTDLANRGMAIQLKFTNRELQNPEPSHICQVLVLQTKPGGKIDG